LRRVPRYFKEVFNIGSVESSYQLYNNYKLFADDQPIENENIKNN